MRILIAHNSYQQFGGEDSVVSAETKLLSEAGHEVETLTASNNEIKGFLASATTALRTHYNHFSRREMQAALDKYRPDLVHVHNFFPRLTPSIFDACSAANVPAVLTLHNYRLTCANGLLFRDGAPCEDCVGSSVLPAVRHRCYRGSLLGSAVVAHMIARHREAGTWQDKVTRFIALSSFSRDRMIAAGLPADRIVVKPNYIPDPLNGSAGTHPRSGFVYVGRLSSEKGLWSLISAWHNIDAPLTVIGGGPETSALMSRAPRNVQFLGHRQAAEVKEHVGNAIAVLAPSICYEVCPMSVIEAMALETPVLASNIGAFPELVKSDVNGMLFKAGDPASIEQVVRKAIGNQPLMTRLGAGAREIYEARFTPERGLSGLMEVYNQAIHDPARQA